VLPVAGDDIARAGGGAADDLIVGVDDVDAVVAVGEGAGAVGVGADVIALDERGGGAVADDVHAVGRVAGDDVARSRSGAADDVARDVAHPAAVDAHAVG